MERDLMTTHVRLAVGLVSGLMAAGALLAGCSDTPKALESRPVVRDTPAALRGTIGAEVTFRGIEPVIVSGLGLVVNLSNTGGLPIQDQILETMVRNLTLQGVSETLEMPGTALHKKTAREVLRDPRTAVVMVQAAIPPGSPLGARFDVTIQAVNATSLEGGQLWTTTLRIGETVLFGQAQARELASAKGPVFINPFAETTPGSPRPSETSGRILNGGWVTNPLQIEMVPDTASHSRVASMVSSINSRFPSGPGDKGLTARGKTTANIKSGPSVVLHVPRRYTDRAAEFLSIVKHLPVNDVASELLAKRYTDALKAEPALADNLTWCLVALGNKSLPFVRGMYDYAEVVPRLAALRAGARLGDAMAAAPLMALANKATGAGQLEAIDLLSEIEGSPRIDMVLRDLLSRKELAIRIAAYEALALRAERTRLARLLDDTMDEPGGPGHESSQLHREVLAKGMFPRGMLQGIERHPIGGKFLLDLVPMGDPLIYVTQQGPPRIVLFGENPSLYRPSVVTAWNDRLIMNAQAETPGVRMMFRKRDQDPAVRITTEGYSLDELIQYFAALPNPEQEQQGFNFTYSEVVAALYAISAAKATDASFATERDRLRASILALREAPQIRDRPETPTDTGNVVVIRDARPQGAPAAPAPILPKIVPLRGNKVGQTPSENQ
jgi:Flagellar P-ring protein